MKICCRLWIDNNGKAFGRGPYRILSETKKHGSLNQAARELGMSYNKAWKTMQMVEEKMGFQLLESMAGGKSGGGSTLTPQAEDLLERYGKFTEEANKTVSALFDKYFPQGNALIVGVRAQEEEKMDEMLAYCGVMCDECPAYKATITNNQGLREETAVKWSKTYNQDIKPSDIYCLGCKSQVLFYHCHICEIRSCSIARELSNCSQCTDFACQKVEPVLKHVPGVRKRLQKMRENLPTST